MFCNVKSVVGTGTLAGEIRYTLNQGSNQILSVKKSDVFYVIVGKGVSDGYELKPRYFNTSFDYSNTYFLKTGKMPNLDDPHLKKVILGKKPQDDWKYYAGKNLKTAGGLMLGSVVLSAVGAIVLSQTSSPEAGYIFLGAGGVSLIAGYGFLIGAGDAMQGN